MPLAQVLDMPGAYQIDHEPTLMVSFQLTAPTLSLVKVLEKARLPPGHF